MWLPSPWIQVLAKTVEYPYLCLSLSLMPSAAGSPFTTSSSSRPLSFLIRIFPSGSEANTAAICELQQLVAPLATHSTPNACHRLRLWPLCSTDPVGAICIIESTTGHSSPFFGASLGYLVTTPFHE